MVEPIVNGIDLDSDEDLEIGYDVKKVNSEKIGLTTAKLIEQFKINRKNLVDLKELNDSDIKKHYSFKAKLGEGAFGKVYLAMNRQSRKLYALKVMNKKQMRNPTSVQAEIESLSKLDHPNLVRFYGHMQTEKRIILVQEYLFGNDLFTIG